MTVEENILKKANQKRLLGDLAIEGGNFTTAYFKSSTIQDLFNIDVTENDASRRMAEVLDSSSERERRHASTDHVKDSVEDRGTLVGVLESALAAAEDDFDVQAARTAKAEAAADLAEFDETIPLGEVEGESEMSRAEQEVNSIVQQLNPIERYAMKFIENTDAAWVAEQMAAAEAEIENQKREWELGRLHALREEEERRARLADDDEMLTFSRDDAQNQVNSFGKDSMSGNQKPLRGKKRGRPRGGRGHRRNHSGHLAHSPLGTEASDNDERASANGLDSANNGPNHVEENKQPQLTKPVVNNHISPNPPITRSRKSVTLDKWELNSNSTICATNSNDGERVRGNTKRRKISPPKLIHSPSSVSTNHGGNSVPNSTAVCNNSIQTRRRSCSTTSWNLEVREPVVLLEPIHRPSNKTKVKSKKRCRSDRNAEGNGPTS